MEIETLDNPAPETNLTKTHQATLTVSTDDADDAEEILSGEDLYWMGDLTVEYKPRKYVIEQEELYDVIRDYRTSALRPEEVLEDLYLELVEALYPGYKARDEPWEFVPMIFTLNYDMAPEGSYSSTITLGSYR